METINLVDLSKPFPAEDIEWRVQSSGNKKSGEIWAKVLAYVTNRAIMDRLDDVCGPENWQNKFETAPNGGVLCGISIRCEHGWVTKWDGSDNTDIEAVKGGLSSSMKRAGSQWGIGRYLYKLDVDWAVIGENGTHFDKLKDNTAFKWNPPQLPTWALPLGEKQDKKADAVDKALKEKDKATQTHEDVPQATKDDIPDFITPSQLAIVDGLLEKLDITRKGLAGWLVSKKKLLEPDVTKLTQGDATAMVRAWDTISADIKMYSLNMEGREKANA